MDAQYILTHVWIGFVGLIFLFTLHTRQRRDSVRCSLRDARDSLFDFMVSNKLDFSHPAYQEARRTLNGMIRLTNSMGPVTFNAFAFALSDSDEKPTKLSKMEDGSLKDEIKLTYKSAIRAWYCWLYLGGITGVVVHTLYTLFKAVKFVQALRIQTERRVRAILTAGYEFGGDEITTGQAATLKS